MSAFRVSRAAWLRCLASLTLLVCCSSLFTETRLRAGLKPPAVKRSPKNAPQTTQISFQPRGTSRAGAAVPDATLVDLPAAPETRKTDNPAAVITGADYKVTIEKTTARIACRFVVRVLQGEWAEVPVNFGTAAVGTLKSDKDESAFLKGIGNGKFLLTLKGEGRHDVQLELLAKIDTATINAATSFSVPPAGITTFEAIIPGDQRQVTVTPTLIADDVKQSPGQTRIKGHLTAASKITLTWQQSQPQQPAGKFVVTANNVTKLRLRDDTLFSETRLTLRPNHGKLSELKLLAPLGSRILDVNAADGLVANWNVEKQKTQQIITVTLAKPADKPTDITVHSQQPLKEGEAMLSGIGEDGTPHGIHAANVARETGLVIITTDARWDVIIPKTDGWVPLELSELPAKDRPANGTALRFFKTTTPLAANIAAVNSRIFVVQKSEIAIQPAQIRLLSQLQYRVERIGVLNLAIRLPTGLSIDRVTADHPQQYYVDTSAEPHVLRLTFDRKILGPLAITVAGHAAVTTSARLVDRELPLLEPLNVTTESGEVRIVAAESLAVSFDPAKSTGLTTSPVTAMKSAISGLPTVAAWTYGSRPVGITAGVKPRQPRLTGKVGTVVSVRESGIAVSTTLNYTVEHAPQTRFRFAMPAAVADAVRITDAAGQPVSARRVAESAKPDVEKPKDDGKPEEAWVTLEVEAAQPVVGNFTLNVQHDLALPDLAENADSENQASLPLAPVRMLGLPAGDKTAALPVTELLGEVSIQRAAALKVSATIKGGDAEAIDVRELQLLPKSDGEHFRYHRQPVSLTLGIQKLDIERVAGTVVSRGLVEILMGQESMATYRCRYRLLSSERQRLRLDLPKSSEPFAVTVNGRSVPLERNPSAKTDEAWTSYLIDIARTESSNTPFSITVQFRMPVNPEPFQWALGRVQLHLPKLLDTQGTPAVVQEIRSAIWVPKRFAVVGTADRFTRRTETRLTGIGPGAVSADTNTDELEQWIGVSQTGVFAFPTDGHYYRFDTIGAADHLELTYADVPFATWVLGIPLLLIGFVLAKTTWQNRLSLGLLLTFGVLFAAVKWSNEVFHGLLAARYGLFAVAVWWIVHAIFVKRPHPAELPTEPDKPQPSEHITLPVGQLAAVVVPPPGLFDSRRHFS